MLEVSSINVELSKSDWVVYCWVDLHWFSNYTVLHEFHLREAQHYNDPNPNDIFLNYKHDQLIRHAVAKPYPVII